LWLKVLTHEKIFIDGVGCRAVGERKNQPSFIVLRDWLSSWIGNGFACLTSGDPGFWNSLRSVFRKEKQTMKTKTETWLLAGLLLLASGSLLPLQARPQWDACMDRINSKGETVPRYNGTCHRGNDGDWCWGHGRSHRRWCNDND